MNTWCWFVCVFNAACSGAPGGQLHGANADLAALHDQLVHGRLDQQDGNNQVGGQQESRQEPRTQSAEEAPAKKPHIFYVLVDDLGWGDVGFNMPQEATEQHKREVVTPNMDWLVQQGVHLGRHYVHSTCQQTRVAAQSGRLPVHVQLMNEGPENPSSGMPKEMTGVAEKLLANGYKTHFVGKWDVGMATHRHTPRGRGYSTSLGYFNKDNDFWTQRCHRCSHCDGHVTDLWQDDGPARGLNGTDYEEFMFLQRMEELIDAHDPQEPMFLFYAPHVAHCPLQVPKEYLDKFDFISNDGDHSCAVGEAKVMNVLREEEQPENFQWHCRRQYRATVHLLDDLIGQVVSKFQEKGMWDDLIFVFTSDNGGSPGHGATNYPLRGGKGSSFEGGVRAAAFVSGGLMKSQAGRRIDEMVHIADWYTTLVKLGGGDPHDERAAQNRLPAIDSLDMWPLLIGNVTASPRDELPLDDNALIKGPWKLLLGDQWGGDFQSPLTPNGTHVHRHHLMDCGTHGCLFNLQDDYTEHHDLAREHPEVVQLLSRRLEYLRGGFYSNRENNPDACPSDVSPHECVCWMALNYYGGFLGPYQL